MKKRLALPILALNLLNPQWQASAQQEPAGASAYLVGVFDNRGEQRTILHIVNPTGADLRLLVAFFDDNEKHLNRCFSAKMTPNRLVEIDVRAFLPQPPYPPLGVVKVVTFASTEDRPQIGVVGNQRLSVPERPPATETGLHPIQSKILDSDLQIIRSGCG